MKARKKMETTNMNLTGKASIDKPWLKYYPEELHNMETPKITLEEFLKMKNPDDSKIAFEYYGNKITWKTLWEEVDKAAKSLKVLGFGDGNRLPMFLPSTPAHYIILLAAERIGTAIICRDDIPEELCFAIRKSKSNTAFVMDYTSKEDEQLFRETTPMTRMIKVSPYCYADKASVPDYVEKEIASRYVNPTDSTEGVLTWDEFMALGENYTEDYRAERNPNRAVFGAYTSGSTGISKLVIHSSSNMVAVAFQMSIFIPPSPVQEKWWLPILPPALIAVTVSMTLFPLSAGLIVVLDPFCPISDVDIAFMEQKPNFWALVPFLCEILMKSDRIPEDYDMS
ncbi:MAG: long-chain fatty acid--CoA ligase, partial [Coprococcus comes]|nr:long-chain fatty acid--CoA ligase [Coprococcus comes]